MANTQTQTKKNDKDKTHLVKTLDVSLVNTEDGSEQGNVHDVVTIPGRKRETYKRTPKSSQKVYKIYKNIYKKL